MGIAVLAVIEKDLPLICELSASLNAPDFSTLRVARSFHEAVQYMEGEGIYSNRHLYPSPTVVLLDATNPHGIDLHLLEWLRASVKYRIVPIGILSDHRPSAAPSLYLDSRTFIVDRSGREALIDHVLSIATAQRDMELTREIPFSWPVPRKTLQRFGRARQCSCLWQ